MRRRSLSFRRRWPSCPAASALAPATALALVAGPGCLLTSGKAPPDDRAIYPTGLALDPAGDHLYVTSSNFDLAFDRGALLQADLTAARAQLGKADAVVEDAYVSAVALPSFGDRPVLDSTGEHLFVTTRGGNLLHQIDVDDDGLSCAGAEGGDEGGDCAAAPHALQLTGNDPFDVLLLTEDIDDQGALVSARGLVTHLSSNEAELFRFDPARADDGRLRVEATPISLGDDVFGARCSRFVPAAGGAGDRVVALVERRASGVILGSDLAVFEVPSVDRGADAAVTRVDITALTGTRSGADLVVVPAAPAVDGSDGALAVVVTLRFPDAIARFSINARDGVPTLTALSDTCRTPTGLAFVDVDVDDDPATPGVPRVLVTCQDSDAVQALDPLTLAVTDAVRFEGRGPYDIVVDAAHGEAFVSFFLDNSVGALRLVDDGAARLTAIGRIGVAAPPPEDGRE